MNQPLPRTVWTDHGCWPDAPARPAPRTGGVSGCGRADAWRAAASVSRCHEPGTRVARRRDFSSLPESTSIGRATDGAAVERLDAETRGNVMTRAEFEADLRQEGYEVREGEIKPNEHREAHAHGFDARVLVLDGSITLVFGKEPRHLWTGRFLQRPRRDRARGAHGRRRRALRLRSAPGTARGRRSIVAAQPHGGRALGRRGRRLPRFTRGGGRKGIALGLLIALAAVAAVSARPAAQSTIAAGQGGPRRGGGSDDVDQSKPDDRRRGSRRDGQWRRIKRSAGSAGGRGRERIGGLGAPPRR